MKSTKLVANRTAGIVEVKAKLCNGGWLCTVTVGKLKFLNYQRDEMEKHIEKLSERYDERKAMPFQISFRNGKLNCMNGRQTSAVLRNVEQTTWDAIVFTGMTYSDEADYFYDFNNSPLKVSGWHKFFAKSKSKQGQDYRAILAIIKSNGLTTPLDSNVARRGNADITSTQAITLAYRKGVLDLLCKVLKGWKRDGLVSEDAKQLDLLRGLCYYLSKTPLPFSQVRAMLKNTTAEHIRTMANTQESKGRIDACQMRQAIEFITWVKTTEKKAA